MLVLTRMVNERVVITVGEHTVVVEVTCLSSNKVRLGFHTSDNVVVDREEVYLAKQKEMLHRAKETNSGSQETTGKQAPVVQLGSSAGKRERDGQVGRGVC